MLGTPEYIAPELWNIISKASKETDIFALGVLLWEIASRKIPFES